MESFNSNNKVTEMLGKVTMIGTMLVPLNVITGLFGMNVKVPGRIPVSRGGLGYWVCCFCWPSLVGSWPAIGLKE